MRRAVLPAFVWTALALATALSAQARGADISTNWSGYAATGVAFKAVSGVWVQPTADCLTRTTSETQSFFWVGLGGDLERSTAIEQIGTAADCRASGDARYSAWYELWPGAPVHIGLRVSAGDRIQASVEVEGGRVELRLQNLTTGRSFVRTVRMAAPDTSSAEWIAEAPTAVLSHGDQVIPLTNFGMVTFTSAKATSASGHTGTISDRAWHGGIVKLASGGDRYASPLARFVDQATAVQVAPTRLRRNGSSFSVQWRRSVPGAKGDTA